MRGTSKEINSVFMAAFKAPKPVRVSPAKRRHEIADAQVAALEAAIATIRDKAREVPAWQHGYHSAITAIELQIAAIRENA